MSPTLHVGAVIDSRMPCAWIAQLLRKVQAHELMQLHLVLDEAALDLPLVDSYGWSESIGQWLINRIIDKPQFNHDPWASTPLPKALHISSLAEQSAALSECDVILHLTPRPLTSQCLSHVGNVWTAELPALDKCIAHCLLTRAPFIWVHLWQTNESPDTHSHQRIASHSLPCQTYSISDLRRLTYSALPSVFMSRLVWLANTPERKLDDIKKQALHQGVFDTEQRQAELDAMQVLNSIDSNDSRGTTNNRSKPERIGTSLTAAISLLVRQSYERVHRKLFFEYWQLAMLPDEFPDNQANNKATRIADVVNTPVHEYTNVAQTNDTVWADPHFIEHDGGTYVFFEKMHKHNENAHIAYAALDKNGKVTHTGQALSAEHHLSFPFVFAHEGECYMIPETVSLSSINLYKANRFPDSWEHHSTLLSGINTADTVIFQHANRWWMFTNCHSHRSVDERDELHIYFADELLGPWQPHALNPVLTGVDRSRMAGAVIKEDGCLYRPSQYGAYRYGFGINLSRIDVLTTSAYRESTVWRILPETGAGWSGCHSFTRSNAFTMIDRVRFRRR